MEMELLLTDDLLEEILLRISPDDPASLVRATLVCKAWRRLISDRGFRRRFRELHATPPMLGFLCNLKGGKTDEYYVACFVPTSSFSPCARFIPKSSCPKGVYHEGWQVLDCRHGRVLLHSLPSGSKMMNALYFMSFGLMILKYDLTTQGISVIHLPTKIDPMKVVLTITEHDGLGFAGVQGSKLYLWSKEDGPNEGAEWAQSKIIELNTLLPANALSTSPKVIGFADGVGVIVRWTDDEFFVVDPKTGQLMKPGEVEEGGSICHVVPYISLYTPFSSFV
ncbi:hypothetical protein ACP70R_015165 [Stipagrostis hirtigluma subsp. patula]